MSTSSSEPTPEVPTDAMPAETQTLAEALRVAGWPASLDCASKQPHICQSLDEFEDLVLYGQHIDRIIVLKDGTRRLQQQSALPDNVLDAARGETCVRSFLRRLAVSSPLEELGGRLYCTPEGSRDEKELTKRDGKELTHLADKWAALPEAAPGKSRVYLGELRRRTKYRHPQDGRWAKTLLSRDICDWLGRQRAEAMPYWDRYDEGVFVGATYGGSPLHVDQVNWSNLGKNFLGHKLLAIWKYGQGSKAMFDEHAYSLFTPPLSEAENAALESAAQVALLGPGDIVVFSGGNAHMALSSSASLSLTSCAAATAQPDRPAPHPSHRAEARPGRRGLPSTPSLRSARSRRD